MASKVAKSPLLRAIAVRNYSSAEPAECAADSSNSVNIEKTVLPNKIVVASIENNSPVSQVSVLFRAGSRNDAADSLGASHMLRVSTGLSTTGATTFGITRNLQQIGANLSSWSDRETNAYTVEIRRGCLNGGLAYLDNVATKQAFKPWELSDNVPRIKYELAARTPQTRVLNLLNRAAYRTGLGNSLFVPKYMVGKIGTETLQHYVKSTHTANRAAVVGLGVDHAQLVAFAQCLELEGGDSSDDAAVYHGGEIRKQTKSVTGLVHVAVAAEGAGLSCIKDALTFAVLQHAHGVGPSVKWGKGRSLLSNSLAGVMYDVPFAVSALNISYTDSGLFGFILSCEGNVANTAVPAAMKVLKSGSVSKEDIARGKAQLISNILMSTEGGNGLLEDIGVQVAHFGNYTKPTDLAATVAGLSDGDINKAAKKVADGNLSLAAIGNLCCLPYLDAM